MFQLETSLFSDLLPLLFRSLTSFTLLRNVVKLPSWKLNNSCTSKSIIPASLSLSAFNVKHLQGFYWQQLNICIRFWICDFGVILSNQSFFHLDYSSWTIGGHSVERLLWVNRSCKSQGDKNQIPSPLSPVEITPLAISWQPASL